MERELTIGQQKIVFDREATVDLYRETIELQSEYFVPRQHAVEAILAVERLRDQVGPYLMISEIRTIAVDNLWLSPCYEQPCVTIHVTWKQDWPAVKKLTNVRD